MIEIIEMPTPSQRNVIAKRDSFVEAKSYVEGLGVVMLEDDANYPNCADAFLKDGRVLAIQPEGFRV